MDSSPIDFARPLPLFPLPNCVLFPGVVQPLHIFEPRYKEMIADALEGQGLLAIALLKEGWEKAYYESPPIHPMVCVAKIIAHEHIEEGKYNLLIHGLARARVLREGACGPYRLASLESVDADAPRENAEPPATLLQRKVLHELFAKTALKDLTVAASLETLFDDSVTTARLLDVLAFTLVQDLPAKQRLLEELDPFKRGEYLLRELVALARLLEGQAPAGNLAGGETGWPPGCNSN